LLQYNPALHRWFAQQICPRAPQPLPGMHSGAHRNVVASHLTMPTPHVSMKSAWQGSPRLP